MEAVGLGFNTGLLHRARGGFVSSFNQYCYLMLGGKMAADKSRAGEGDSAPAGAAQSCESYIKQNIIN